MATIAINLCKFDLNLAPAEADLEIQLFSQRIMLPGQIVARLEAFSLLLRLAIRRLGQVAVVIVDALEFAEELCGVLDALGGALRAFRLAPGAP